MVLIYNSSHVVRIASTSLVWESIMNQQTPHAPWSLQEPARHEFATLARHLAKAQRRCSDQLVEQAREIAELKAQAMRLRAQIVVRDSELAWAAQDRTALALTLKDLPERVTLLREVMALRERVQTLVRDALRPTISAPLPRPAAPDRVLDQAADLEASIVAADLVICQTGCLSHGAYWRVQDHCKRTGKTCMLVAQPASVRIVRIHQDKAADAASKTAMNPV